MKHEGFLAEGRQDGKLLKLLHAENPYVFWNLMLQISSLACGLDFVLETVASRQEKRKWSPRRSHLDAVIESPSKGISAEQPADKGADENSNFNS